VTQLLHFNFSISNVPITFLYSSSNVALLTMERIPPGGTIRVISVFGFVTSSFIERNGNVIHFSNCKHKTSGGGETSLPLALVLIIYRRKGRRKKEKEDKEKRKKKKKKERKKRIVAVL
jgi:hypothetical protein